MQQNRFGEQGKAIVIGAGISGLCTAIALQKIGWKVEVYERARELKGIGAGIVLAANAMKALVKLGAAERVRSLGAPVKRAEIREWNGRLLVSLPVEEQAKRYGADSYMIHRADLQEALVEAVNQETICVGHRLLGFTQGEHGVRAYFENGAEAHGDILIGADGIHSQVRRQLFGEEPLRYSGYTAVRGITTYDHERYPVETGGGFEAWGKGVRFGLSHIGKGRVHWFAAINAAAGAEKLMAGDKEFVLSRFFDWYAPVRECIAQTDSVNMLWNDIYDRKPLRRWSVGRVTLAGDAAHPMLPNLGQGAGQGMEDALVLARCLQQETVCEDGEEDGLETALRKYETERMSRTAAITRGSRLMGRMVQLENPFATASRNLMLRLIPSTVQSRRLDWIVGHEV